MICSPLFNLSFLLTCAFIPRQLRQSPGFDLNMSRIREEILDNVNYVSRGDWKELTSNHKQMKRDADGNLVNNVIPIPSRKVPALVIEKVVIWDI